MIGHSFSQVPSVNVQRSVFDRSHHYRTTFDSGLLIPFLVDEAVPGDTFEVNVQGFARLLTPKFPYMDNLWMTVMAFAVPYRLVWENWEKFNGAQDNPEDSTDFVIPTINSPAGTGYEELSIYDYMGLPTKVAGLKHSALPLRAYNLIWNEWFRDQNLQPSVTVPKGDGPDDASNYKLLRRGKRKDYFTGALPWPQKGPSVLLPLGTEAPVVTTGTNIDFKTTAGPTLGLQMTSGSTGVTWAGGTPSATGPVQYVSGLKVDLTPATAVTINELRQVVVFQQLLERDARYGTRYVELIKAHFGVVSPDFRLQRPEFLGGRTTLVGTQPIAQTSTTENQASPLAHLAAIGTADPQMTFRKSFTEHCIIIGVLSVRADLTYQNGIDKMWTRETRFDFLWPDLAQIGEQAVLSKEIWADGTGADDDVFGYVPRYDEYRWSRSKNTGRFRSNAAQSLDAWHLAQDFSSRPVLNASFIEDNPPVDRISAVTGEPHFKLDAQINMRCTRPLPVYGVPGIRRL